MTLGLGLAPLGDAQALARTPVPDHGR